MTIAFYLALLNVLSTSEAILWGGAHVLRVVADKGD